MLIIRSNSAGESPKKAILVYSGPDLTQTFDHPPSTDLDYGRPSDSSATIHQHKVANTLCDFAVPSSEAGKLITRGRLHVDRAG